MKLFPEADADELLAEEETSNVAPTGPYTLDPAWPSGLSTASEFSAGRSSMVVMSAMSLSFRA